MDVSVVVPLLTAKIAESKRKKGATNLLGNVSSRHTAVTQPLRHQLAGQQEQRRRS